jgi:peptidoglycan hydrolase-like protein with peptidoglycan-binding domain
VTRPGGRGLAALLLAAVLGVSGGVVAALQGPAENQAEDPGSTAAPRETPTPTPKDTLGLNVPREDLDCDGDTYILVGWGDSDNALWPSVVDWPGVKYLDTRRSCPTAYPKVDGKTPRWVAYLPGYDDPPEACEARMTVEHKDHFVTRMRKGAKTGVLCACVLDVATLPAIEEGQPLTTISSMWIYMYQRMLIDVGLLDMSTPTQVFDHATARATYTLQSDADMSPTGVVDTDTWRELRSDACRLYKF